MRSAPTDHLCSLSVGFNLGELIGFLRQGPCEGIHLIGGDEKILLLQLGQ